MWSCYAPCSSQHLDAVQIAVEQIDVIRRLVEKYPLYLSLVSSADGKCFIVLILYDIIRRKLNETNLHIYNHHVVLFECSSNVEQKGKVK